MSSQDERAAAMDAVAKWMNEPETDRGNEREFFFSEDSLIKLVARERAAARAQGRAETINEACSEVCHYPEHSNWNCTEACKRIRALSRSGGSNG